MSIRKKILLYFSVIIITLAGISFLFIYTLFAQYREEEFQQRQKEKITNTLKFLTEIKNIDEGIIRTLDEITINKLYNEKLLIFDSNKMLIYSSIDDTPVPFSAEIINALSSEVPWIETKDGHYDVVGMYMVSDKNAYYAISKAYDVFGYSKLQYLKYVLWFAFVGISVAVLISTYYLSGKITQSIVDITEKIKKYDFEQEYQPVLVKTTGDEIDILAQRFNELMKRMHDAFSFQKHAVHHISHELKTPISILVTNFEKIEKTTDLDTLKKLIKTQKEDTRSLSEIISSLLEIAKVESGNQQPLVSVRIDEMLFDIAEELRNLYPEFYFSIEYLNQTPDESLYKVQANARLLKSAFLNLMLNCVHYADQPHADIVLIESQKNIQIDFINSGPIISEEERMFLFKHFFRGNNSKRKRGFGLGLVFVNKIIALHKGSITYKNGPQGNIFSVTLPLS